MRLDPENPVVSLCVQGMEMELTEEYSKARDLFRQAWAIAQNDFEKFTAAHYVARHQSSLEKKLEWDQIALSHAQAIQDPSMNGYLPSLYLNIAKGYEDLGDFLNARRNYNSAEAYSHFLSKDGYGALILSGIAAGMDRIKFLTG